MINRFNKWLDDFDANDYDKLADYVMDHIWDLEPEFGGGDNGDAIANATEEYISWLDLDEALILLKKANEN